METIYEAFLAQARKSPQAVAVIDERGAVTYAHLAAMAADIAKDIPEGASFVGVIMDHGVEMIAAMLAILKTGAAYVPAEPSFPPERIAFMLQECDADAVITQAEYEHLAGEAPIVKVDADAFASRNGDLVLDPIDLTSGAEPKSLAYVLYTSGTTGTPKGVSVENRNVCSYIKAFQHEFGIGPGDTMLQYSVCSFDIFVEEVFGTLLTGAALVIAPEEAKADPKKLVAFIDEHEVTIVDGFPFLMDDINSQGVRPVSVRLYISGGDVLHESQVSNLVHEAMVYNTYGPSETTCCASYYRCDDADPLEDGTYPVGHPILGTKIAVVDEGLRPVFQGQTGEFLIEGPGVSRGYLGQHPEQANFIVGTDGSRRYRSGDMGYEDENGNLVFLHRKDDQVMIGGKRVEAKEVENVLLQDEAIHQAVVVPGRDEAGFSYLVAYIVAQDDGFSLHELKERLGLRLTPFMIPEFFVKMRSIPLNSHGKPALEELPVVLKDGR